MSAPVGGARTAGPALLSLQELTVKFGGVTALQDVSLSVFPGEAVGLIGPNGAGKTTLFNVCSGLITPTAGQVEYEGTRITRWAPARRFQSGILRTFQTPEIVTEMSVVDNVLLGVRRGSGTSLGSQVVRSPRYRRRERDARQAAVGALEMVGLLHKSDVYAGQLPLGEVRLMELARCLVARPKLLLLDELASGLTDDELGPLEEAFKHVRASLGASIVLVEHNVKWVMDVVERVHVLDQGRTLLEGAPAVVRADPRVIEAYLGRKHATNS